MEEKRTDSELVALALDGYRSAFQALYDRHAAAIHDFCARSSRDPDNVSWITTEVFTHAAEHLRQLRDPSRFRPWLFAIARYELAHRSSRLKSSVDLPEDIPADRWPILMSPEIDPDVLAPLLRDASVGLGERDRVTLELTLAHGMAGHDLADALGVREDHANEATHRMRERLTRVVGALVVARQGQDDCAELRTQLAGWDGRFDANWAKKIARHVDGCEVCWATSAVLPELVFSGTGYASMTPVVFPPVPESVRSTVLDHFGAGVGKAGSGPDHRQDFRGFVDTRRSLLAPALSAAGAVLTVVAVIGGIAWLSDADSSVKVEAASTFRTDRGEEQPDRVAKPPVPLPETTIATSEAVLVDPAVQTAVDDPSTAVSGAPATGANVGAPGSIAMRPGTGASKPPTLTLPGFFLTGPAATPSFIPPPTTTSTSPPDTAPMTTRPPSPTTTKAPATTTTTTTSTTTTTTSTTTTTTTTTIAPVTTTTVVVVGDGVGPTLTPSVPQSMWWVSAVPACGANPNISVVAVDPDGVESVRMDWQATDVPFGLGTSGSVNLTESGASWKTPWDPPAVGQNFKLVFKGTDKLKDVTTSAPRTFTAGTCVVTPPPNPTP